MNARQLEKLGVPAECMKAAILAIQSAASTGVLRSLNVKQVIKDTLENPGAHLSDPHFGPFAQAVLEAGTPAPVSEPIAYRTWGDSGIDAGVARADAAGLRAADGRRRGARCPMPTSATACRSAACWRCENAVVPVRRRRRHRLPHEAVGARHAGLDARRSAQVRPVRAGPRRGHAVRRRLACTRSRRSTP